MREETARSVLRLIAVVTVLVGAILTTTTLVALVGVESTIRGATQGMQVQATGMVAQMGFYAVLAYVLVAAWGFALYLFSPNLARKVVE